MARASGLSTGPVSWVVLSTRVRIRVVRPAANGWDRSMGQVIAIHGASGGLGVSTLSVAVAVAAVRAGRPACLVDGVFDSGGLDVTACVEHVPGLRWPDLAEARGSVDGSALVAALPFVTLPFVTLPFVTLPASADTSALPVLASGGGGQCPPPPVQQAVMAGLLAAGFLVVLDQGVGRGSVRPPGGSGAVLVATTSVRGLADARAARTRWGGDPGLDLLVRGDADLAESLADHLGLPLLGWWPEENRVVSDATRGRTPGARRSHLSEVARLVLGGLASVTPTSAVGTR